jgi:hypothetical protein
MLLLFFMKERLEVNVDIGRALGHCFQRINAEGSSWQKKGKGKPKEHPGKGLGLGKKKNK